MSVGPRAWWMLLAVAACDSSTTESLPSAIPASAPPSSTATALAAASDSHATLAFAVHGREVRQLRKSALAAKLVAETFTAFDPYYGKNKTYRALAIDKVLELGLGDQKLDLTKQHFVLKASDGYTVPIEGAQLLGGGAYIAVADAEVAGWQPIGPQQANPGPFYLVWRKPDQQDLNVYPRPWQLARIEVAAFESTFPDTAPRGQPADSPPQRGFAIFRQQCIRCHAVNRQGGRVGPELNVPRSIVEYRPVDQIRAYIRDPRAFRYGNMPSNPHLSGRDLDDLLAYFRTMSGQKHDPDARSTDAHGKPAETTQP